MTLRQARMLIVLAALWGGSFLFIRVAVDELGAVVLTDARLLLAAATLALILAASGRAVRPGPGAWRRYVLVGAVNAALPFTLIALAEETITASLAAILNASAPLFAATVAAGIGDEPFTASRAGGLLLGVAGVALVVGLAPLEADAAFAVAVACSLGAAACYAVGATYVRHRMAAESPNALAVGQRSSSPRWRW
jgi:drug/metabolite transporter (DMT)-like permease